MPCRDVKEGGNGRYQAQKLTAEATPWWPSPTPTASYQMVSYCRNDHGSPIRYRYVPDAWPLDY